MPFPVAHPVEANGAFVAMDEAALKRLRALGWNVYRFTDGTVRFMCSWATTPEIVEEIGEALRPSGVKSSSASKPPRAAQIAPDQYADPQQDRKG